MTGIALYLAIVALERLVMPWHASMRSWGNVGGGARAWVTPQIYRAGRDGQLRIAACSGGDRIDRAEQRPVVQRAPSAAASAPASAGASAAALDEVRLQFQWAPQAQFAGYFAAKEQGYYQAEASM